MQREAGKPETRCAECGTAVDPMRGPVYSDGGRIVLCCRCAGRRGALYDTKLKRWSVLPDLTGLLITYRPHP